MKAKLELPRKCGIYLVTCNANNKIYVGSTFDFRKRWNEHRAALRANRHTNPHLQNSWNKYGEQSFTIAVLEICERDKLMGREQYYLDLWQPFGECGFNISRDATTVMGGRKHKPETIAKMSGRQRTPEHRAALSASLTGNRLSPETRAKISAVQKGKPGRKHTLESRAKMSQVQKGRKLTPAQRDHLSAVNCKYLYIAISPDGEEMQFSSIKRFCAEHGLAQTKMYKVANGLQNNHKGWRVRRLDLSEKERT